MRMIVLTTLIDEVVAVGHLPALVSEWSAEVTYSPNGGKIGYLPTIRENVSSDYRIPTVVKLTTVSRVIHKRYTTSHVIASTGNGRNSRLNDEPIDFAGVFKVF
ncbi:hypothetical protein GCM10027190_01050 [Spirosoma areae]